MAHSCNPSTLRGRSRQISEFEASLFYRVSSGTARVIQRNPVSKKPNPKVQKKQKQRNQKGKLPKARCRMVSLNDTFCLQKGWEEPGTVAHV